MPLQRDPEGFEKKILQKYAEFVNKRVLEVGCGEGRLTWKYADAPSLTVGFDPDHEALCVARADSPSALRGHIHLTQASASYIPFSKEKFDIAILAWSL